MALIELDFFPKAVEAALDEYALVVNRRIKFQAFRPICDPCTGYDKSSTELRC